MARCRTRRTPQLLLLLLLLAHVASAFTPAPGAASFRRTHWRWSLSSPICATSMKKTRSSRTKADRRSSRSTTRGSDMVEARPPAWCNFERWLKGAGATCEAVTIAECDGGLRGIVTTRIVQPGEVLISIPRHAILDVDWSEESPASGLWRDVEAPFELPGYAKLALAVLHEVRLGENSSFAHYIRLLPSAAELAESGGPAATWSNEELALSECGKLAVDAKRLRARRDGGGHPAMQVEALAARWNSLGLGGAPPTQGELEWAITVVTSRALSIQLPPDDDKDASSGNGSKDEGGAQGTVPARGRVVSGLIPMVDLLNHDGKQPSQVAEGLSRDGQHFVVVARTSMAKGQQVFLSYGTLPNVFLLLQFGFLLPSLASPPETAFVSIAHLLEQGDEVVTASLANSAGSGFLMCEAGGSPAIWQPAGKGLRFAMAKLAAESAKGAEEKLDAQAVVDEGERLYRTLLLRQLESFSTTLDEDRAMLAAEWMDPRRRMALELRASQKKLLLGELGL